MTSVVLAMGASTFGLFRQLWAFPDATWQTTLYYLADIDMILTGRAEQAIWFELGNGHAMSGYRIFTYLNAALFGLDSSLELIVYWALVLFISIVFALIVVRNSPNLALGFTGSTVIIIVMNSLAGAGARGMEIGTYTGTFLILCLALLVTTKISTRSFFLVSMIAVPVTQFFFLGGYMAGWVFSFTIVTIIGLLQNAKKVLREPDYTKLLTLGAMSLFWMAVFYLLIPKTHSTRSLFDVWGDDILFPLKFIVFGFTNAVFTSQSFEFLAASDSYPIYLIVGIFLFLFCLAAVLGSLTRTDSAAIIGRLLIFYGLGTSILILLTRAYGDGWLLSSWYSFHFKLALCGAIILFVTSRVTSLKIASIPLLVLIAALSITSSKLAFDRNPHERSYFQNIQRATYFPDTIVDRGDGNTQLIASVEESLAAIKILKKHQLGVYRPGAFKPDDLDLP
jgi:hypothetical protein